MPRTGRGVWSSLRREFVSEQLAKWIESAGLTAPVKTCQVDLQAPLISWRWGINTPGVPSAASQSKKTINPSHRLSPGLSFVSPRAADTSTFDKVITSVLTLAAEVKADGRMVETRFQDDECSQNRQTVCVDACLDIKGEYTLAVWGGGGLTIREMSASLKPKKLLVTCNSQF